MNLFSITYVCLAFSQFFQTSYSQFQLCVMIPFGLLKTVLCPNIEDFSKFGFDILFIPPFSFIAIYIYICFCHSALAWFFCKHFGWLKIRICGRLHMYYLPITQCFSLSPSPYLCFFSHMPTQIRSARSLFCWRRSWRGHDCQLTYKLDQELRAPHSLPSLECTPCPPSHRRSCSKDATWRE